MDEEKHSARFKHGQYEFVIHRSKNDNFYIAVLHQRYEVNGKLKHKKLYFRHNEMESLRKLFNQALRFMNGGNSV